MGKAHLVVVVLALLALSAIAFTPAIVAAEQTGPRTDTLYYKRVDLDKVKDALLKGDIDVYIFGIPPAYAVDIAKEPDLVVYTAPAGLVDYILNPAPVYIYEVSGKLTLDAALSKVRAETGKEVTRDMVSSFRYDAEANKTIVEFGAFPGVGINPFAFRDIRFAINYAVDRGEIVSTIYKGFASAMYTFLSIYDPDFAIIADIVAKYRFAYDLSAAEKIINDKLLVLGAEKIGTYWYFDGSKITVKFIIRVEDERRDFGDHLALNLVRLGFYVERLYLTFADAITKVYYSDPKDFEWHIYTEGWGKSAIDKYDYGTINQFGAPWYTWMPGWQEPGYWNYANGTIDEVGKTIFFGKFKSAEERHMLYRQMTEMVIQESVRIWGIARLDVHPTRKEVKGVSLDLGTGLRPPYALREMYSEAHPDYLLVGHRYVWTATSIYNPWGGFLDVYSVDIMRLTTDPAVWRHPWNGMPIAFRMPYEVETAGPDEKLNVPSTALVWDAVNDKWVAVGDGVKAASKVEFDVSKYIGAKWHHGITITWADIIGTWGYYWELALDPDKSSLEAAIAGTMAEWISFVKGVVFDKENKKVVVYIDYWHFSDDYIADYAVLSPSVPVELHEAMFTLAFDKQTHALSGTRARRAGIPHLSLVVPDHAGAVVTVLGDAKINATIISRVTALTNGEISEAEWRARCDAVINWVNARSPRIAWISHGAYYLDYFDTAKNEATLKAFRDPTYPFKPGDWLFGIPVKPSITEVLVEPLTYAPGDEVTITVKAVGPEPLTVLYIVFDPVNKVSITSGEAELTEPGTWVIKLESAVTEGFVPGVRYELTLMVFSEQVAIPGIATEYLEPVSRGIVLQLKGISEAVAKSVGQVLAKVSDVLTTLTEQGTEIVKTKESVGSLSDKVDALASTVNTLQTLVIVTVVLVLVSIALPFVVKRK